MGEAVKKLKEKKQAKGRLGKTFADEAAEGVEREKRGVNKGSEGYMAKQARNKGRGKRKAAATPVSMDEDDVQEVVEANDATAEEDSDDDIPAMSSRAKSNGKASRKRTKV